MRVRARKELHRSAARIGAASQEDGVSANAMRAFFGRVEFTSAGDRV